MFKPDKIETVNCTYKRVGKEATIKHKDAPLFAPYVTIFNGTVFWDFSKLLIMNKEDMDKIIENLIEINNFIHKIKDEENINDW